MLILRWFNNVLLPSAILFIVTAIVAESIDDVNSDNSTNSNDYIEEKNHTEALNRILRDFEKTLDDNKKIYDLDHVDSVEMNTVEDAVTDTGVSESKDTPLETPSPSDPSPEEEKAAVENSTKSRLACNNSAPVAEEGAVPGVLVLNGSQYQAFLYEEHNTSVTNRSQPATCSITMFFASWCEFSAGAAPHYNALARVFPQIRLYAVDSSIYHSLNTQFGVMAVPSIFVFHNGRPLFKYNYTEYSLPSFTQTFSLLTGLEPENVTEVTEADYLGPVPSEPVVTTNYYLILACLFTAVCGAWHASKSRWLCWLLDTVGTAWREAEIVEVRHEHED